jgi:hypothetical protein
MRRPVAFALALVLSTGLGCQSDIYDPATPIPNSPDDVGDPTGLISEPEEGPIPAAPVEYSFDGAYNLNSHLDIAGSGILGDRLSDALIHLSEFHDNPAGAILEILSFFDIPIYSEIWPLIPDFLKDYIEGWINDILFDPLYDAFPGVEDAFQVVQDIFYLSRDLQLRTTLTLKPPNSEGGMRGEHVITGLGFVLWDMEAILPIPDELGAMTLAEPHAILEIVDSPNPAMPDALLTVDRHTFSIPYGAMLLEAAGVLIFEPAGADDLGSYMVTLVDCNSVAENLIDDCATDWLGEWTCLRDYITHDQVEEFCSSGLTSVGDFVAGLITDLSFDLFALDEGRVKMYDRGAADPMGDGICSELRDGVWKAQITMGLDTRIIPAKFEGVRVPD